MTGELFLATVTDAELLDLGWPARDHEATEVELRIEPGEDAGVSVRCSWFAIEAGRDGASCRSLEAWVSVPLDPDQALALFYALGAHLGIDGEIGEYEELDDLAIVFGRLDRLEGLELE